MFKPVNHIIGFDDAPFEKTYRGDVLVIGTVYAGDRIDGVLRTKVRRDGVNSTKALIELVNGSRFHAHNQAILLQGIAFAGFNVIDIHVLNRELGVPVIVVMRHRPDLPSIKRALLERVRGGRRKWELIKKAGEIENACGLYIQLAGIDLPAAAKLIKKLSIHSRVHEPLRSSHLIAGGVVLGHSTGMV